MKILVLSIALAAALPARAQDAADPPAIAVGAEAAPGLEGAPPAPAAPERGDGPRRWGLAVDAGFPEGAAVSAVFRPVSQLRLWAGPTWNVVAYGLQGGVTFVPWHLGVSPTFSVEGGRYFSPDASFIARRADEIPDELEPLLEDVKYDYAAAHVGVEIGTRDGFAFSLRAGLAYVSLRARGQVTAATDGGTGTVTFSDPHIRGTVPSVKLGLQLWF
jgi:hypothetical protein